MNLSSIVVAMVIGGLPQVVRYCCVSEPLDSLIMYRKTDNNIN